MSDDLTARRNQRTMAGVIACGPPGVTLHQEDIDEVARFKGFLTALGAAGIPGGVGKTPEQVAEWRLIYAEHYPEYSEDERREQ